MRSTTAYINVRKAWGMNYHSYGLLWRGVVHWLWVPFLSLLLLVASHTVYGVPTRPLYDFSHDSEGWVTDVNPIETDDKTAFGSLNYVESANHPQSYGGAVSAEANFVGDRLRGGHFLLSADNANLADEDSLNAAVRIQDNASTGSLNALIAIQSGPAWTYVESSTMATLTPGQWTIASINMAQVANPSNIRSIRVIVRGKSNYVGTVELDRVYTLYKSDAKYEFRNNIPTR